MYIEVFCYNEANTKAFCSGVRHGEFYHKYATGLNATLVNLRQERKSYGNAGYKNIYSMVLFDGDQNAFKAVINSGLSATVEKDIPRVGAQVTFLEYEMLKKSVTPDPLIPCGVIFANKLKWEQPPEGQERLKYLARGETPTLPQIPPDYNTLYFCNDYVDWVHTHACFSASQSNSTPICNTMIWFYERKSHLELKRQDEMLKKYYDHEIPKRFKPMPDYDGESENGESESEEFAGDDTPEDENPPCECVSKFGYAICINLGYPLTKVDTTELFLQVTDRIGEHGLLASTFDDLPAGKKRWCFYWWYAVNLFHLSKGCQQLPKCFVSAVRKAYDDGKPFTGFKSKEQRLEESNDM